MNRGGGCLEDRANKKEGGLGRGWQHFCGVEVTVRMGMLMAAKVARHMWDPNLRDSRDDVTQVSLADKWWEVLKVAEKEMSLAQICISGSV